MFDSSQLRAGSRKINLELDGGGQQNTLLPWSHAPHTRSGYNTHCMQNTNYMMGTVAYTLVTHTPMKGTNTSNCGR